VANANFESDAGTLGISRWWRVVGGVSMNLALGSLYAWSVFVAPLEKEFKWKRAETSMVFTIAVVVFALTFIVAGRLQDKLGPFKISLIGAILVSLGFFLCSSADSLTKFLSSSACLEGWATALATRPRFLLCPSGFRTSAVSR
jgi:MFS transporter, OFA family, oxalate/formate antiporter